MLIDTNVAMFTVIVINDTSFVLMVGLKREMSFLIGRGKHHIDMEVRLGTMTQDVRKGDEIVNDSVFLQMFSLVERIETQETLFLWRSSME